MYTYLALWDVRPHLGGCDPAQAVTHVWPGQVEEPRQWPAFPADESAAGLVARIAAGYPLVDPSVREPDVEAAIGRMYAEKAVS